jgi:hypothetical protein
VATEVCRILQTQHTCECRKQHSAEVQALSTTDTSYTALHATIATAGSAAVVAQQYDIDSCTTSSSYGTAYMLAAVHCALTVAYEAACVADATILASVYVAVYQHMPDLTSLSAPL